jgi:hypothetical protein
MTDLMSRLRAVLRHVTGDSLRHRCPFCGLGYRCDGCVHCLVDLGEGEQLDPDCDGAWIPCVSCASSVQRRIRQGERNPYAPDDPDTDRDVLRDAGRIR